jgi:hypothetical protein
MGAGVGKVGKGDGVGSGRGTGETCYVSSSHAVPVRSCIPRLLTLIHPRRHHERGMLSVRDRLSLILDPDSPFLELMPLAGYNVKHSSPNASAVCGIGLVQYVNHLTLAAPSFVVDDRVRRHKKHTG